MAPRRFITLGLAAIATIVLVIVITASSNAYVAHVLLTDADGLDSGSQVKVGGVPVGTVADLRLGAGDQVIADLHLDPAAGGRVGHGASIQIVDSDLLGAKYVELLPGKGSLPSGATIAADQVSYPVDLDQVLDVLDPTTLTKLQIILNELGIATDGERENIAKVLTVLPKDFGSATTLLDHVVTDNHSLHQTVVQADRVISSLAEQRMPLAKLIQRAGSTLTTAADQRQNLATTLQLAPSTLRTAQSFLVELRSTATPLGPAARLLAGTAPSLVATLDDLTPVQRAAEPALREATRVAPALTKLADRATPTLVQSEPTLSSVATFAQKAQPLSYAVSQSADNLLAILEGWGRAIQDKDGVGHIFRGAVATDGLIQDELDELGVTSGATPAKKGSSATVSTTTSRAPTPSRTVPAHTPSTATNPVSGLANSVGGLVHSLEGAVGNTMHPKTGNSGSSSAPTSTTSLSNLLNYLTGS